MTLLVQIVGLFNIFPCTFDSFEMRLQRGDRGSARKNGAKPGLYNSLVPKIDVGVRNDQMLKVTALKSNRKSLLWSAVIRDYLEEGAIRVKKCHTEKDCNYS